MVLIMSHKTNILNRDGIFIKYAKIVSSRRYH